VRLEAGETLDSIGQGSVRLIQNRTGYRFSIDAVLLAHFASPAKGRAIDLGTGCGVIPLLMTSLGAKSVTALELQPSLHALATRNVEMNGRGEQVQVLQGCWTRVQELFPPQSFDLVVSNPPYRACNSGKPSPNDERAKARHETVCDVKGFAAACKYLTKPSGRVKLVYATDRMLELMIAFWDVNVTLRSIRHVHGRVDQNSKLILCEMRPGDTTHIDVLPPLILHDASGAWTPEVAAMLGGAAVTEAAEG
jgi:tRNA1Val (adenine37-N6)-methyltransferase